MMWSELYHSEMKRPAGFSQPDWADARFKRGRDAWLHLAGGYLALLAG